MHPLYCSVQNILERTWLSPLHGRGAQGGKAALECQCPAGSPATSRTVDVGRAQGIIFLFCGSQRLARLGTFISAHVPFHVHHTPFALQRDMSSSHPGPPPLHYKVSPAGRARLALTCANGSDSVDTLSALGDPRPLQTILGAPQGTGIATTARGDVCLTLIMQAV